MSVFDRIRAALKSNLDGLWGKAKGARDARKVSALEADLATGRRELALLLAAETRLEQQGRDKVAMVRKLAAQVEQAARAGKQQLASAALAQKKRAEDETRALAKVLAGQRKETDELQKNLDELEAKLAEVNGGKPGAGTGAGTSTSTSTSTSTKSSTSTSTSTKSSTSSSSKTGAKPKSASFVDDDGLPDLSRFDVGDDDLDQDAIRAAADAEVEATVRAAENFGMAEEELKSRRMDLELERLKQKMRTGGAGAASRPSGAGAKAAPARPAGKKAAPSSDPLADLKKKLDRK